MSPVQDASWLSCPGCGQRWDLQPLLFGCPACAAEGRRQALEMAYDVAFLQRRLADRTAWTVGRMWDFADFLPPHDPVVRTTLGEGGTPLLAARKVAAEVRAGQVLMKLETTNPTGAFKDRLNAVSVTVAREFGYSRVLCTTTGNHGVSLAAYAAAAGLECLVACEPGTEALAVRQMRLHGARVVTLDGSADAGRAYLGRLVKHEGWWPSVRNHPRPYANPFGLEGYKAIAFEVWAQLGERVPDRVFVPTGGGDSLAGVAKGFHELCALGLAAREPVLVACQPAAADSLVRARRRRLPAVDGRESTGPTSVASLVTARTGDHALRALGETGVAVSVDEHQIRQAITLLGRDGYCVDPASAVAVAGLLAQGADRGRAGEISVCILTASGQRWPDAFGGIDGIPGVERVANA